jgi:hypothetical protein
MRASTWSYGFGSILLSYIPAGISRYSYEHKYMFLEGTDGRLPMLTIHC